MWAFFSISIILVVIAVVYMLTVFPAKGITLQVKFVTGYAWLTTLMICCIVPLDVVATLHGENIKAISVLWDIPYWSTQVLTWFLIPVYMEYSIAGEFTWGGRMWRAIRSNLLFYCLMASIGAAGLLWGTARGSVDLESLPALGMQLSNTFGLVCVLALMGFGLVNIPRSFWKHSNPEALLRYKYYELGKIMEERDNAAKNLNGAIEKVLATKRILGRNERDALQHIEDMLTFIREHTGEDVEAGISASVDSFDYADELPQLHAEVMKEVYHMGAIQARALHTIKKAIWLSEVRATRAGREPRAGGLALEYQRSSHNRLLWKFWCFVWPYVLKLCSVVTLALGALILWCEVTIGFEEDVSPLSKLIHSIHGEFFDQAVIMAFMVYVITCTYNAFFAIGLGSLYMLTPGASTSFSLLFNGTLMARFAAPLCFNYLHVIRMNTAQHGQFTTFAQKMGLDVPANTTIPFLALGFNQWAPWLLMVVVVLVGSNALGLIYRYVLCCLPQGYASNEDDEDSNRYVMEGERLVERERLNVEQGRGLSDSVRLLNSASYVSSAPVTLSRTGPPSRASTDPFTRLKQDRQSLSQSRLLANTSPLGADSAASARQTSLLGSLLPKGATGVQSPSGSMSAGLLSDSSSPPSAATELARKYGRASKKS